MAQGKLTIDQHTRDRIDQIFDTRASDGQETIDENPAPIDRPNESSSDNRTLTFNDSPITTRTVKVNDGGDFSSYHRCKKYSLIQNLETVGAFSSVGISSQNLELELMDCNISESDSDSEFDIDEHMSDIEEDDHHLNDYILSTNDYQKYGEPPQATFARDLMVTQTQMLSLGCPSVQFGKKRMKWNAPRRLQNAGGKGCCRYSCDVCKKDYNPKSIVSASYEIGSYFCISFRFYYGTIRKWLGKA